MGFHVTAGADGSLTRTNRTCDAFDMNSTPASNRPVKLLSSTLWIASSASSPRIRSASLRRPSSTAALPETRARLQAAGDGAAAPISRTASSRVAADWRLRSCWITSRKGSPPKTKGETCQVKVLSMVRECRRVGSGMRPERTQAR